MAADDPNRHREPALGDGVVPDFMTALAHANQRTAGPRQQAPELAIQMIQVPLAQGGRYRRAFRNLVYQAMVSPE